MDIKYLGDKTHVIPIIAKWSYEEWLDLHPDRTLEDVELLFYERTSKDEIPLCLLAFEGNAVVGMVCLKIHDLETRKDLSPWLATLYVDKNYRNKGIGSRLVKAIEDKAKQLGIKKLYLYTPKSESFYQKLNWRIREYTEVQEYKVTVMEKELIS